MNLVSRMFFGSTYDQRERSECEDPSPSKENPLGSTAIKGKMKQRKAGSDAAAAPPHAPKTKMKKRRETALRMLRGLHEDLRIVKDWYRRKGITHTDDQRMHELWFQFTSNTTADLRRLRPGPGLSLEEVLRSLRSGENLPGDRRTELCHHQCVFVGGASRSGCDLGNTVSWCVPNPAEPDTCAITLCFDVDELDRQLSEFDRSGVKRMRNPAHGLSEPEGIAPAPEYLDGPTVEMLRWQVSFTKEWRVMKAVTLERSERGILYGVVFPIMVEQLRRWRDTSRLLRLFQRYTPSAVKRMLRSAGNVLMMILNNPWLNTVAVVLAKTLRLVSCWFIFGITDAEWEDPGRRFFFPPPDDDGPPTAQEKTVGSIFAPGAQSLGARGADVFRLHRRLRPRRGVRQRREGGPQRGVLRVGQNPQALVPLCGPNDGRARPVHPDVPTRRRHGAGGLPARHRASVGIGTPSQTDVRTRPIGISRPGATSGASSRR